MTIHAFFVLDVTSRVMHFCPGRALVFRMWRKSLASFFFPDVGWTWRLESYLVHGKTTTPSSLSHWQPQLHSTERGEQQSRLLAAAVKSQPQSALSRSSAGAVIQFVGATVNNTVWFSLLHLFALWHPWNCQIIAVTILENQALVRFIQVICDYNSSLHVCDLMY